MLAAGLALASCADDELASKQAPVQIPAASEKTFDVSMDGNGLSKASLWFRNPYSEPTSPNSFRFIFFKGDKLSVFSNGHNNTFMTFSAGTDASFTGNAEDASAYYALFPVQADATIDGNVIKAKVAEIDSIGTWNQVSYNDFPKGALCVGYSKGEAFGLKHATGYLNLLVPSIFSVDHSNTNPDFMLPDYPNSSFSYFNKIVIEANENIAGDVQISVGEDGIPAVSGGTSKTITVDYPYSGGFIVGILPVSNVDLKITFYRIDGETFTCEYPKFSVKRAQGIIIRDFVPNEKFKVTFKDGSVTKDTVVVKGTYDRPGRSLFPAWYRDGYRIKWLDEQGNEYVDTMDIGGSTPKGIVADRVFTASWEKVEEGMENACSLTYPTNDGDKTIQVKPGYVFTLPELPEGHIYWENPKYPNHGSSRDYDSEFNYIYGRQAKDFKLQPGDKVVISESTTLYPNQYNRLVTVDANGGKLEDGSSVMSWRYPDGLWGQFLSDYDAENMAFANFYFEYGYGIPDQKIKKPTRDGYQLVGFKLHYYGSWQQGVSWPNVYDNSTDIILLAEWQKIYKIEYLDENGNVAHTGGYIDGDYFDIDFSLSSSGKFLEGWMDQDGNMLKIGTNLISALDCLKDLRLTPVFSDKSGSTNVGYDEEKFDRF